MIRIDKYLADCGIGTRSEVKKYIKAKQITVNGALVSKPEEKVDETKDDICFKGHSITYEKYVYYLFLNDEARETVDWLVRSKKGKLPKKLPKQKQDWRQKKQLAKRKKRQANELRFHVKSKKRLLTADAFLR